MNPYESPRAECHIESSQSLGYWMMELIVCSLLIFVTPITFVWLCVRKGNLENDDIGIIEEGALNVITCLQLAFYYGVGVYYLLVIIGWILGWQ